jgi:hypothetical protein
MDIEPAAVAAGKETAVSASIRRSDEEQERECPAEEGAQPERPLPPPEDYVRRVRELHEVALARSEVEELADALTAGLAWVIFNLNRPEVTGDVLVKLGRHIEGFAARERAMRELEEMRERGGLPS